MKQALPSASGIRFLITEVRTNIQRAFNAINWRNVLVPFLIVALMLPLAAVTPVQAPTAARVQPVLLQMAVRSPIRWWVSSPKSRTGHRRLRISGTHGQRNHEGSVHQQRLCGRDGG